MRGEAAVDVVAREDLFRADLPASRPAGRARTAWEHGGHHGGLSQPALCGGARLHDDAADLVAEREREGMAGGDAVVEEAQVGVADAAPGHLDDHLAGPGRLLARFARHRAGGRPDDPRRDLHGQPLGSAWGRARA